MNRGVEKTWNFVLVAIVVYFAVGALRDAASPAAIAALVAAPLLFPFIFGPFLIHRTHWSSLDPGLIPFDPDGPASPEALRSHFAGTSAELERLGFVPERYYRTKQATTNAEGAVLLFRNDKTWETARVLTGVSTTPRSRPRSPSSARSFPTGPRSSRRIGRAPASSRRGSRRFTVGHSPRSMTWITSWLSIVPGSRTSRRDESPWTRSATIRTATSDVFDFEVPYASHVASGYTYVDEMARVQRMTWKGAILSTWKFLPPIKQMRLAWERMMAARQLGNLKAGRPVF